MSLLEALEECQDNDKAIDLLPDLPFKKQIIEKTFDIEHETLDNLLTSLKTYSYLCLDSEHTVKEIVWILGGDKKLFDKFFVQNFIGSNIYELRKDIDTLQYNEICRV